MRNTTTTLAAVALTAVALLTGCATDPADTTPTQDAATVATGETEFEADPPYVAPSEFRVLPFGDTHTTQAGVKVTVTGPHEVTGELEQSPAGTPRARFDFAVTAPPDKMADPKQFLVTVMRDGVAADRAWIQDGPYDLPMVRPGQAASYSYTFEGDPKSGVWDLDATGVDVTGEDNLLMWSNLK